MKYHMLAGYLPSAHQPANPGSKDTLLRPEHIRDVSLTYPQYFSSGARDLVNRMVVVKPQERANLREVAQHRWLSDYAHIVSDVIETPTGRPEFSEELLNRNTIGLAR